MISSFTRGNYDNTNNKSNKRTPAMNREKKCKITGQRSRDRRNKRKIFYYEPDKRGENPDLYEEKCQCIIDYPRLVHICVNCRADDYEFNMWYRQHCGYSDSESERDGI